MRVGIIDDDEMAVAFVERVLIARGYRYVVFRDSREMMAMLACETFDLLIIDWNLPEINGLEIVRWVRANIGQSTAILMLTARNDGDDLVVALEAGADDYIVKPETAKVTAARVDALLRRAVRRDGDEENVFGRYVFDRPAGRVTFDDRPVILTPKEYALALCFFDRRDRPLSRTYLLESVWTNLTSLSTRTLDMHVSRLRAKLFLRPEHGFRIETVLGYGYRLNSCDGRPARSPAHAT